MPEEGPSISESGTGADPLPALRFATGRLGCLLVLLAPMILLFGWWALRPELLAGGGRWRGLVELVKPMTAGGINIPAMLLALFLVWELFRMGMRWADRVAVAAGEAGLDFHWTLRRQRRVGWDEVRDARFRISTRNWARVPEIVFVLRDGAVVTVRGFDDEGKAGERFAAAVRERAGLRADP